MSLGLPRPAQAGLAAGLALSFAALASSPALADHVRSQEWWLRTLHVTQAWRSTQGRDITVALLDTGVAVSQPDLTGSVILGPDYTHSGRTAGGAFWGVHGTAMASLIAGHGHGPGDSSGVTGVAPKAKILSVRVTLEGNDPELATPSIAAGLPKAIARGIKYAVRHGATVIDLPLDPAALGKSPQPGGSPAERSAVSFALSHNVVLVAPAGDGGAGTDPVNYPAAYPGVISVGAFSEAFTKAPYSSHRPYVTLTASGDGVIAANGPKGYAAVHSTSAASAVVAGIAALIKSQFPQMTPAQVRQVLTKSTVFHPKGGRTDGSGYGTVDATAALMAASSLMNAVPTTASSGGGTSAPPKAPAVHSTVVHKNLGHSLMTDAGIAVAVFVILLVLIYGATTFRRRRARSARLAEVRAAARVPVRRPAANGPAVNGAVSNGNGSGPDGHGPAWGAAPAPNLNWSGTGNSGSGMPGAFAGGGGDGLPGSPGRATPRVEPAGFVSAPPLAGSLSGFAGPGPLNSGSVPTGSATDGSSPGAPGVDGPGGAIVPVIAGAPPWAPVPDPTTPGTRFRGASQPAIPESAFPAAAPADPAGATDAAARAAGRRAQGSHRAPVRAPNVTGTPPWEPAARPDSELPWTQAPAPASGLPQPLPAAPEAPAWETTAEAAWPGGPRGAAAQPSAAGMPAAPTAPAGLAEPSVPAAWGQPTASPSAGSPQGEQPIYVANPDAAADPRRAARPEPGSGFLRGGRRPAGNAQPPAARGPATPAGAAPDGPGPAGRIPAPNPGSPVPARPAPGGAGDAKSNIPPWEITDSFLAIRTDPAGPAHGEPAIAGPSGPVSPPGAPFGGGQSSVFGGRRSSDEPAPASGQTGLFGGGTPFPPATPAPATPAPAGPAQGDQDSPGFGRDSSPFGSRDSAPLGGRDSSPFGRRDSAPFGGRDSSPFGRQDSAPFGGRDSSPFGESQGSEPGFGRGGSFPSTPAAGSPGFGRGSGPSLFGDTRDAPSFPRGDSSFPPATPAADSPGFGRGGGSSLFGGPVNTPGFPRGGSSFPGQGESRGFPGTGSGLSGSGPAGDTENIPALPPTASGLPRRTPLSERPGNIQAGPPRDNSTAFRLFPPAAGESTESLPAVPPKEKNED